MSERTRPSSSDAAAAIDEVLLAESAARQATEACRQEAERILEAAREDARRITRIANQRVTRLHNHCDGLVRERIDAIRASAGEDAVRTELNAADREMLGQAVARLAARLTRPADG
jgi:vacuolar-type H+-ATPase subunit H